MTSLRLVLAAPDIDPDTGHGPEWGKAAPVALLIIVLLGIALFFLIRSMNKQLKRVPKSFGPSDSTSDLAVSPAAEDSSTDEEAPVTTDDVLTDDPSAEQSVPAGADAAKHHPPSDHLGGSR